MIEIGLAPDFVARYLRATRGEGSEYLRDSATILERFFGDVLESLDRSGIHARHVKLYMVNSVRADIETLHYDDSARIIFDQGMMDLFDMLNRIIYGQMSRGGLIELPPTDAWVNSLFAHRFLAQGKHIQAAVQAAIAQSMVRNARSALIDDAELENWVIVQSAFAIAHETAHCRFHDGDQVFARGVEQDFEDRLLPLVRQYDQEQPVDLAPAYRNFERETNLEIARRSGLDLSTVEKLADPSWGDSSQRSSKTLEEQLDLIMHPDSALGEEILCDYWALMFTTRILGGKIMHPDEALIACFLAFLYQSLVRHVEGLASSYHDDRRTLKQILDYQEEITTRMRFFMISAQVNGRLQVRYEHREGIISDEDFGSLGKIRRKVLTDSLNRVQAIFRETLLTAVTRGIAGQTHFLIKELPEDHDLWALADLNEQLSDFVRACTKGF